MSKEYNVYFKQNGKLRILAVTSDTEQGAIASTIQWAKEEKMQIDGAVVALVK